MRVIGGVPAWLAGLPILAYQRWISPGLPATCRFRPSCSSYALEALRARGVVVGLALALWRILRCHPFNPGGYDPVPAGKRNSSDGLSAHRRNPSPAPSVQCSTPPPGVAR